MRRFSLGTEPYREMSESNLAIIAREFRNRGFIEDEEEEDSDNGEYNEHILYYTTTGVAKKFLGGGINFYCDRGGPFEFRSQTYSAEN